MPLLTISPTASEHDAYNPAGGAAVLNGTTLPLTAGTRWAGLFLPAVALAGTDTVNRASLFYKASNLTGDDPDLVWYGNDVDDAAVFSTGVNDVSGRTLTTASATDSAISIGNSAYREIDITAIVQEIQARGGWASGNDMALVGDCTAACNLQLRTWDSGVGVWYVEIDYSAAGAGGVIPRAQASYRRRRG